jgi:hypothetical protein
MCLHKPFIHYRIQKVFSTKRIYLTRHHQKISAVIEGREDDS